MNSKNKFIPPKLLNTPVLFLIFNRLDTTKRVFAEIRKAKPPRLYIASDGARKNVENEEERVENVREYIISNIDWDCKVETLFRGENLGCKYAVSGAITWFFKNEEQGIVLEDDCLPDQSFFWYCEELLEKYKNDMRIGQISGDNFQDGIKRGDADYYFSIYNHIWGWASWANRWDKYDVELTNIKNNEFIENKFTTKSAIRYWTNIFKKMKAKSIDTWDYQWTFTMWYNNWLTILPNKNLISNIGFGKDATHTTAENQFANMKTEILILKKHPLNIKISKEADNYTQSRVFKENIFIAKGISFLKIFGLYNIAKKVYEFLK